MKVHFERHFSNSGSWIDPIEWPDGMPLPRKNDQVRVIVHYEKGFYEPKARTSRDCLFIVRHIDFNPSDNEVTIHEKG